ncbi:P-II family nitrogen regulator [Methanobacterium ferruginis]|jgi:nitrogen regulatory protein PII 2|uniref:P-II family nitrogen regulator n=1 Tax=Methanobacterium ferruginis TaxID=710191 RepID=UPI002572737E|nr:P-II family nitrogen regulator [Methanobacterium ferruginis]BDZ67479.1 nitrogen fixation nifHD region glnB 2 [Methanobacterium ferruginis]
MKEITAIIRPNKINKTKKVLDTLGFPAMTAQRVLGRGKQKAIIGEVTMDIDTTKLHEKEGTMRYIPKRMLTLLVPDQDVQLVVEAIMRVNQTGQKGDGRIFVSPLEETIRVRTGEKGDKAII